MANRPSGAKIRAIIKRPDEQYGHVTNISPSMKNLQKTVDGYVEAIKIYDGAAILCNEDAKYCCKPRNFQFGNYPLAQVIAGTVVVVGLENGEFVDCPIDFKTWKELLKGWGN